MANLAFQVGDTVCFKSDHKITGRVIGSAFYVPKGEWMYTVQWNDPTAVLPIPYSSKEAEARFELVTPPNAHLDEFTSFEKLLEENTKASFDALTKWYDDSQVNPNQKCAHVRKTYFGFTESYDYCDKCGEKL